MTEFQKDKNNKKHTSKTEKIAILSVLKPVDDVRAYQKIAKSISEDSKEITLIGFEASSNFTVKNNNPNIHFIELFTSQKNKNRLGFWRFFAGFRVFNQLLKIKPTKIIVCAVELLPFTLFFKFLFNSKSESKSNPIKIIYDVQENYSFNILYQDNYPHFLKKILAFLIQRFEKISSSFIDVYLLAEKCYVEEMPYLKKTNYVFLENKFLPPTAWKLSATVNSDIQFLLYGSFSKTYGTLEGILLFKKLEKEVQKQGFSATLLLVGYCSDKEYSTKILESIKNEDSILIINEDSTNSISKPVSHTFLLEQLQKTDFVILPYLSNKSTQNCIPTKFYECLAYQKPMLISGNWGVGNGDWGIRIEDWRMGNKELGDGKWELESGKLGMGNEIQIIVKKILYQKFYTNPIDETVWKFDREIIRKIIK